MNCPHTTNSADDDTEMKTTTVDSIFGEFLDASFRIWNDGSLNDNEKASEVRRLIMLALAERSNTDDDDETSSSHFDGPAEPHTQAGTLESFVDRDGFLRRADGHLVDVRPRKMSREELQLAVDNLVGGRDVLEGREDREIQAAIDRREARNLMSGYRGGYHR